jgi:hypothetical protein
VRIEKIQSPDHKSFQWRAVFKPRLVLPLVALVTLIAELALVERKFTIFGGGFLQSQQLDQPAEIAAFALGLLASHLLLLGGIYVLLKRLHGRASDTPLFYLNFLFFVPALAMSLLVAKFQVLSYFSDAIGFQVIRNLGGGSLLDPFLYVLDEASLLLLGIAGAVGIYIVALRLFGLSGKKAPQLSPDWHLSGRGMLAALALLPFLMLGTSRVGDAGYALAKFNSYVGFSGLFGLASDFDRDGYSFFSQPIDSHPFDSSRYPLALDVPGNGIDEDGFGGDFSFSGRMAPLPPPVFPADKRHVVLIVLESVRGDAMEKVIDGRRITPNLAALAAQGTAVPEAYSHVGFTTASLKSLFTGKLDPLDDRQSLFRDFEANGYRVGVLSGQSESFGDIAQTVGMKRYSDLFIDAEGLKEERSSTFAVPASLLVDGQVLLREFDRNLARPDGWKQPNFLYLNFQSAHFPYHSDGMKAFLPGPPIPRGKISLKNKEWVERTYWNSVAYSDWLVGQVVERLKKLGVYENSLVVVTADHGESLFDDGFLGHGHMINRQQTHIPLVINRPSLNPVQPLGLNGIRSLLLKAAGAELGSEGESTGGAPVFQFIGSIDRPISIGFVERGGRWTTLNLTTREVWSTETGKKMRYDTLPSGSSLERRVERLIRTWETERWLRHIEFKGR